MWYGFDADIKRQLAVLKDMTRRRHSTPVNEWPVVFKEDKVVLIVREWPNGELTAYVMLAS
jgi:hypothetical protein